MARRKQDKDITKIVPREIELDNKVVSTQNSKGTDPDMELTPEALEVIEEFLKKERRKRNG